MANITFLSFLLFSMCHSIHVAVNTWLNCSLFTLMYVYAKQVVQSEVHKSKFQGFRRVLFIDDTFGNGGELDAMYKVSIGLFSTYWVRRFRRILLVFAFL